MDNDKTILIVDDESHILHVLDLKLSNAGFNVVTAEDGEEAFEIAIDKTPDLVITDYQMPVMNGLELSQKLRENDSTSSTPILMLTARGANLAEGDIDETNIAAVLSKPFSPREILARVQKLVEWRKSA